MKPLLSIIRIYEMEIDQGCEDEKLNMAEFLSFFNPYPIGAEQKKLLPKMLDTFKSLYVEMSQLRCTNYKLEAQVKELSKSFSPYSLEDVSLEEVKFDNLELEERIDSLVKVIKKTRKYIIREKRRSIALASVSKSSSGPTTLVEDDGAVLESIELSRRIEIAKVEKDRLCRLCDMKSDMMSAYYKKLQTDKANLRDEIQILRSCTTVKKKPQRRVSKLLF